MNWYNFTAQDVLDGIDLHVKESGKTGSLNILMQERVKHLKLKKTVESMDTTHPDYKLLKNEVTASSQQVDLYAWAIERIYNLKDVLNMPIKTNYMQIRSIHKPKNNYKNKLKRKGKRK